MTTFTHGWIKQPRPIGYVYLVELTADEGQNPDSCGPYRFNDLALATAYIGSMCKVRAGECPEGLVPRYTMINVMDSNGTMRAVAAINPDYLNARYELRFMPKEQYEAQKETLPSHSESPTSALPS